MTKKIWGWVLLILGITNILAGIMYIDAIDGFVPAIILSPVMIYWGYRLIRKTEVAGGKG